MKTIINNIGLFSLIISASYLAGCSSDSTDSLSEADAREAAEEFTQGEAKSASFDEAEDYWKVEVELPKGAEAEVEVANSGEVLEVKSEDGPFDYDISFGKKYLSLEEAIEVALEIQQGEIQLWEFKLGSDDAFFWEFYIEDDSTSLWEVKITAEEGELLDLELKDAPD